MTYITYVDTNFLTCSQNFEVPASSTVDNKDGSICYPPPPPTVTAEGDKNTPPTSNNNKSFPTVSQTQ